MQNNEIALKEVARVAVAEQYHYLEQFKDIFRKYSKKRSTTFLEPFLLKEEGILLLDNTILESINKLADRVPCSFTAIVRLKNRQEQIFNSINEIVKWREPEKSYPVNLQLNWKFSYLPKDLEIPIPLQYDIFVEFETEPNHANKEQFAMEESITAHIEGPEIDWVRALQEKIENCFKSSHLPWWWRYFRKTLFKLKPFFNNGAYIYSLWLAWLGWSLIYGNPAKDVVTKAILSEEDIAKKINIFTEFWNKPEPILKFMVYFFAAMIVAGGLHLLLLMMYEKIAPPSVIAIGIAGQSRVKIVKVYGAIWMLVIGGDYWSDY